MTSSRGTFPSSPYQGRRRRHGAPFLNPASGRIATYFLLVVGAIVFTMPLLVMVFTSFKSFGEINTYPADPPAEGLGLLELRGGVDLPQHGLPALDAEHAADSRVHAPGGRPELVAGAATDLPASSSPGVTCGSP